jgi:outer membrane protein TolC
MTAHHQPSGRTSYLVAALCAMLLVVYQPVRLAAQDSLPRPSDTLHLTLEALLDTVRVSHPSVMQGSAAALAANERRNALGRVLDNPDFELQHTSKNSYLTYLRQPIIWPWQWMARRRLGDADVAVAHADAEARTDSVALDAAQRFADALRSRAQLALASEAESLARVALKRAELARQLGQGGDLTVLQARVTLDASRRERANAREASRVTIAGLALLLGVSPDIPLVPEGDLATVAPLTEPDSGFTAQAVGSDPEMKRYAAVSLRARREASMWRAHGRIPDLAIGPTYGWTINPGVVTTPGPNFGLPIPRLKYLGIDVTLSIPLWHGHAAETEAANQDRAAADAGRQARERELDFLVLDATSTLSHTDRQLSSLRKGDLARAAQADSLATNALRQGGPYLTTWLTARQAYLDARRAELDLLWQAAQARLILRYLTGSLREDYDEEGKGNGQ